MSRFDSDLDHSDWLHGPYRAPNLTCARCGEPFHAEAFGIGLLCDRCCDQRDADKPIETEIDL
jgi:hypothetical protein